MSCLTEKTFKYTSKSGFISYTTHAIIAVSNNASNVKFEGRIKQSLRQKFLDSNFAINKWFNKNSVLDVKYFLLTNR